MAEDNYSFVRDVLNELRSGLGPYIIGAFADHFGVERNVHLARLKSALSSEMTYRSMDFECSESVLKQVDIAGWLKVMRLRWDTVFKDKLGEKAESEDTNVLNARAYMRELIDARNKWGHETEENQITLYDALRISGTAKRLLLAVEAAEFADSVRLKTEEFVQKTSIASTETVEVDDEAIKRVDLSGLNLSGIDLRGRNLHLANLRGADLSGSDLRNAHLANMDLFNVKLSKAVLESADLTNSNLTHAKIDEADLRETTMSGADLSHANLRNSDLSNSEETVGASSIIEAWETADYDDDDDDDDYHYQDTFLRFYHGIRCAGANFNDAILSRTNMRRTFFETVDFRGADLTGADFTGSRIGSGTLTGAILRDAILSECELLSCDFSGATMQGMDLSGAWCVYSRFSNADMQRANLKGFFIDDSSEDSPDYSWTNVDLSEANLSDAVMSNQVFRNANLTGALFKNSKLTRVDFSNADLKDTDFTNADLTGADFTGARFYPFSTILPDGTYWDEVTDMTRFTGPAT